MFVAASPGGVVGPGCRGSGGGSGVTWILTLVLALPFVPVTVIVTLFAPARRARPVITPVPASMCSPLADRWPGSGVGR